MSTTFPNIKQFTKLADAAQESYDNVDELTRAAFEKAIASESNRGPAGSYALERAAKVKGLGGMINNIVRGGNSKRALSNYLIYDYRNMYENEVKENGPKESKYIGTYLQSRAKFVARIPEIIEQFSAYVNAKHPGKENSEKKKPEAPQDAPLGQYAFPDSRGDDVPYEVDTSEEEGLYGALYSHFQNGNAIASDDAELMRELLKAGWYSDVFKPPTAKIVYRGMTVPEDWLIRALNVKKRSELGDNGSMSKGFTFTPRQETAVSSWTTSKSQAMQFSKNANYLEYRIIMHARVRDNNGALISGPDGLYDVAGFDSFPEEKEVLALGPIKVFKVEWR